MKVINLELSKRLNEWWYLDDIKTKYIYSKKWSYYCWEDLIKEEACYVEEFHNLEYSFPFKFVCKTLTLEESMEFMPDWYMILKTQMWSYICEDLDKYIEPDFFWDVYKSPIQAIEKTLEHLLDNNLLNKW